MDTLEHNRMVFAPLKKIITNGNMKEARDLIKQNQDDWKGMSFFPLFQAIVLHDTELVYWERAVESLSKFSACGERLFALDRAISICRQGGDDIRVRTFLQLAESIARDIGDSKRHLQYLAMYANQLYLDGYTSRSTELLEEVILKAVTDEYWLLVVSQATILSGILLQQQDWVGASNLSVILEEAAVKRKNWIGVACAVMTRASAWFAQDKEEASIRLLLETGRLFHERGFVSALHLIKARLAELRAFLGEDRFNELCEQV
ncbi:MAG: hypothetical protein CL916_03590 [Deltaproteobacteria bacterium]|nr:hypothetical protein [Deltaproteobacteria bacterium]